MNLSSCILILKHSIVLLKLRGPKYVYNYYWLHFFYGRGTLLRSLLLRLFYLYSSYPRLLEIENTTRCNLRCIMCEHTYWDERNQDMSFGEFKHIIEQFPPLKFLGLTGIGESLLNRDFMKMLEFTRQRSRDTIIELYDTFYLMDTEISLQLIELCIDHIYLSFDAATKETYEKIRIGSNFQRVINNVKTFMQLKKQVNAHFPEITVHYIISKMNVHEVPEAVKLAKALGISRIYFTKVLHPFREIEELMPSEEAMDDAIREARREAFRLKIEITLNVNIAKDKPPIKQCNNWIMPFIFVDGFVFSCCAANEANRRQFQKENSLGNIFKESFKNIWFGERFETFRKMIRKGKVPEYCKDCPIYNTKR